MVTAEEMQMEMNVVPVVLMYIGGPQIQIQSEDLLFLALIPPFQF